MTTHRAVVECFFPPKLDLIASGPEEFCRKVLVRWAELHPTPQFSRAYVMEVVETVVCEPGVGVYVVPKEAEVH